MNDKVKDKLIAYCKVKGWGISDAQLMEVITDATVIQEGKRDRHRWYTLIPSVIQIDDMFLRYDYCDVDGETSNVEDCIGGYKLGDVVEVFPKEIKRTIYVTKDKLDTETKGEQSCKKQEK